MDSTLSVSQPAVIVARNNADFDTHPSPNASVVEILPQELWDNIIDFLAEDGTARTSLFSCSLVCRAFLPRSRKHTFKRVYLSAKAHSQNLITAFVDPRTLFFVKDLTINFTSAITPAPLFGPPRASEEVGRWIPSSFENFPMLESLHLLNMSWGCNNADDKLLNHLIRGLHNFRTLGLTGLQFPDSAHVCALVRAAPQLKRLGCVGVDFDTCDPIMSCAERHTWDQLEVLNVYPGSFRPAFYGEENGMLKAILDPSQCPAALPALHTIHWFVEQTNTAPLNKLLSMTCSTVQTLSVVMFSVLDFEPIELTHLAHVCFDLDEWDGTPSDGIETIRRILHQLQREVVYALESLELKLSKEFKIYNNVSGFEELWGILDESLACRKRFPYLCNVHLQISGALNVGVMRELDVLPAFRAGKSEGSVVLSGCTM